MLKFNERYIVDGRGKKTAVVIDIKEFEELMEKFKKYEEVEMYDTDDVTKDIIEAFKDLKKEKVYFAKEILNELWSYGSRIFQAKT